MSYILLSIGFIFLIKGADIFVDGSSTLAKKFSIPPLIIGLTIVAFGTSAPEFAVSLSASLQGANDMALGNIIGSNLFNLLVVLGISGLFYPLHIQKETLIKDFPYVILVSFILIVLSMDSVFQGKTNASLSMGDGIILLAFLVIFMYHFIHSAFTSRESTPEPEEIKPMSLSKSLFFCVFGIAGIIIGGQLVINSASEIARQFGMSEKLVGLTIVAIGTSLPELVTSVVATIKKETDIAIGNVLGSNIFNILLILGISATISPISVNISVLPDLLFMLFVSMIIFFICLIQKRIGKFSGILLTISYIIYMIFIIIRN